MAEATIPCPLGVTPLPGEEWRRIPGFEGCYRVSNRARVWSEPRHGRSGALLKPWLDDKGYLRVDLHKDGKRAWRAHLHQVVALAFLGPCPEGEEVRHGPAGKTVNEPWNLSYGSHWENISLDMARDGTRRSGERVYIAKLTIETVGDCRRRAASGESVSSLSRELGVTVATMWNAVTGKNWPDCPVPPVTVPAWQGERNHNAKLTAAIVLEARARKAAGESMHALAKEFGVSPQALRDAVIGKTWKHVRGG